MSLVKGHTLRYEGFPYGDDGKRLWTTKGIGKAKCSCGSLSPVLTSNAERKRWHKDHKEKIRKENNQ